MSYGAGSLLVDQGDSIGESEYLYAAFSGQLTAIAQSHLNQEGIA